MAEEDEESVKRKMLYEQCTTLQSMIEISAGHLDGLRTCAIDAEIIQKEIRNLEGKLIRLFSKQLLYKAMIPNDQLPSDVQPYPLLRQWLRVVGLSNSSIDGTCKNVPSLESLLEKSGTDIRIILFKIGAADEEIRRLSSALENLKICTEYHSKGASSVLPGDVDLSWDSWDRDAVVASRPTNSSAPVTINNKTSSPSSSPASSHALRSRASRSSIPSEDGVRNDQNYSSAPNAAVPWFPGPSPSAIALTNASNSPLLARERRYTPPSTPPVLLKKGEKIKFPTTPPPRKKQTITNLVPEPFPLTKSKSHESQLANRIDQSDNALLSPLATYAPNPLRIGRSYEHLPHRQRLATEPNNLDTSSLSDGSCVLSERTSPQVPSPLRSPPYNLQDELSQRNLVVPKSPHTPTVLGFHMGHTICHRFGATFKMTTCEYCSKQMFFGYRCKECKFVCHRDCALKVPPSCGLPNECLDWFRTWKTQENDGSHSPIPIRAPLSSPRFTKDGKKRKRQQSSLNILPFAGHDSSSNTSSCNSSTPSSPALLGLIPNQTPTYSSQQQQFQFPDVATNEKDITIETRPLSEKDEMVETQKSNDSDKTVSGTSGSTDSEKTLAGRVDSQDSQVSDMDPMERSWPRQNSLSLKEWDIPYQELAIEEKLGTGRFGTVYKGNWHGDVAIKVLNMDHVDDEKILEAFKQEVGIFRKTRHENLVLFMGACMKPPHLAIVTSLCKGKSLYVHIHVRKERFNMGKIIGIAQQILQGMGYLHARGIVHKDLKTKNIFLENGKVIITDFGLFSVTRLCYGSNKRGVPWLTIPPGWLCYLSPEIICDLRPAHLCHEREQLPFTMQSDVYAFGTVWYELLCGEWPFKGQPPEAIIWQVGRGIKQSLASIQASHDVKDILMSCWAFKPAERLEMNQLQRMLERLPKKRLARSPSHPVHLSRSAESMF